MKSKRELIGKKVEGFRFESITEEGLAYNDIMESYIGQIGEVMAYNRLNDSYLVDFKDDLWSYPASHIEAFLIEEDISYEKERKEILDAVNGGDYRKFDTGSVRDSNEGKPRVADMEAYVRLRFGFHMLLGAEKYSKKNYLLGQPDDSSLESIHRHLALYEDGDRSEDHLCAIMFGIQNILLNEKKDGREPSHYYNSLKESKDEK